jgi:hypothetical protein
VNQSFDELQKGEGEGRLEIEYTAALLWIQWAWDGAVEERAERIEGRKARGRYVIYALCLLLEKEPQGRGRPCLVGRQEYRRICAALGIETDLLLFLLLLLLL